MENNKLKRKDGRVLYSSLMDKELKEKFVKDCDKMGMVQYRIIERLVQKYLQDKSIIN